MRERRACFREALADLLFRFAVDGVGFSDVQLSAVSRAVLALHSHRFNLRRAREAIRSMVNAFEADTLDDAERACIKRAIDALQDGARGSQA